MKSVRTPRVSCDSVLSNLRVLIFFSFVLLGLSIAALGQQGNRTGPSQFYPDLSDEAESLMRNASNHVREGQWGEAIDIYQRVIRQYGDKVARLRDDAQGNADNPSLLWIDIRQYCQRRIAALPPEARGLPLAGRPRIWPLVQARRRAP